MAKTKVMKRQSRSRKYAAPKPQKPEETQKILGGSRQNLIDDLYFGVAEETFQESSYHADSQFKPYNPDDLYQKTNDYSIYEDMMHDDQVSVCMNIKKDLVIGSGWDIVPGESNDSLQLEIKEAIEKNLLEEQCIPFDDQLEEILSAYEFGFSLTEKIFMNREDGSLGLKFLKTRHPSTWLIHTDVHGNVEKFEQRGVNSSINVDPRALIHFVNKPKFQNPYGKSDLRMAYNAWFVKRQIVRFYGIFLEKAASPTPVARYDEQISQTAVEDIYDAIKKLQTKTALAIPKKIELEFLEAKSNGEAFIKGINIFNMFIGRALIIPDLLGFQGAETSGGSFSLGKSQIEVLFKHILRRRSALEHIVNRHIIWPQVVYNWGFVENYPKFKLRPISDEYLIELAKLWIEVMKGKIYQPSEEEINHFRTLAKFPEGDVNFISTPTHQNQGGDGGDENGSKEKSKEKELQGGSKEKGHKQGKEAFARSQEGKSDSDSSQNLKSETGEGETKTATYSLPPGSYSKKVDFAAIGNQMDSYKGKILTEASPIIKKIFEDLFQQMENKKIIKDAKAERIEELKPKYLKELKMVLLRNLRNAHKDGMLMAQRELLKGAQYRTPLPNDKFMEVLDAELFQYIGDWSYNLTKGARIALIAAIKDGKPLSSVIDALEVDGISESEVSIERYARTKITEVMNRGRLEFFEDSGVVAAYQYSAILDDRTTDICAGLDGKIFQAGSEPVPPLHFNCRSLLVPITKYEQYEVDDKVGKTPIQQFIEENKGDGFSTK